MSGKSVELGGRRIIKKKMIRYYVSNSKGSLEKGDLTGGGGAADTLSSQPDSVKNNFRQPATPVRATTIPIMH